MSRTPGAVLCPNSGSRNFQRKLAKTQPEMGFMTRHGEEEMYRNIVFAILFESNPFQRHSSGIVEMENHVMGHGYSKH